jgi:hypothetical protein
MGCGATDRPFEVHAGNRLRSRGGDHDQQGENDLGIPAEQIIVPEGFRT